MRRLLILPAALLLLTACGGTDVTGPGEDDDMPSPPATAPDDPADPESGAKADLAAELGIDQSEIEVVSHESVTWRDGSMGCPEAGGMYTQALVDGYRIVLAAGGEEYHYHGAAGEPPFRCDNPDPDGTA